MISLVIKLVKRTFFKKKVKDNEELPPKEEPKASEEEAQQPQELVELNPTEEPSTRRRRPKRKRVERIRVNWNLLGFLGAFMGIAFAIVAALYFSSLTLSGNVFEFEATIIPYKASQVWLIEYEFEQDLNNLPVGVEVGDKVKLSDISLKNSDDKLKIVGIDESEGFFQTSLPRTIALSKYSFDEYSQFLPVSGGRVTVSVEVKFGFWHIESIRTVKTRPK